ncbi:hypothetical protein [[Kitasatospora] papulosa]|uniref:hypothetical protein n=1 Tax=[Kitasatospora] papulosa TaxID=1464011 RepID=UPI0036A7CE3B
MLATAWSVADQLGLTARTAGDLVAALAGDRRRTVIVLSDVHGESVAELVLDMVKHQHLRLVVESRSGSPAHRMLSQAGCAELNLDLEQWRDQQRFEQWQASQPKEPGPPPISCEATIDLSDPVAVCEADPWLVTDAYSAEQTQGHGGLRDAWLRAGQALCQEQAPASRALTLLAALSDGADPRLAPALAALAGKTQWQVSWSRVRGDLVPPWPGPVTALAQGRGPVANVLLAAGREGVVRLVREADGSAHGRLSLAGMQPQSMTVMADGTVLVLDEYGRVHAESGLVGRPSGSGIEALLDDGPTSAEVLIAALRGLNSTALAYAPGTAGGTAALGDSMGVVRTFGELTDSAALHVGPVAALAAVSLLLGDERVVLLYSGGVDGTVRVWAPGGSPMDEPLVQRRCPVVSLDVRETPNGLLIAVAWGDGEVECLEGETGLHRTFRPGPPVRAVAIDSGGRVVIGMDASLVCMAPRTPAALERAPQEAV